MIDLINLRILWHLVETAMFELRELVYNHPPGDPEKAEVYMKSSGIWTWQLSISPPCPPSSKPPNEWLLRKEKQAHEE